MKKPKLKVTNSKGITLVALVITIIILLILATVSISLIINSGIINKAKYVVNKYNEEEEFGQVQLAVMSAQMNGNGLTKENLDIELQATFNNNETVTETSKGWNYKGYKIDKDGNVKINPLPKEYQEVEYIQSTGSQYIDTGIKGSSNIAFEISFMTLNSFSTKWPDFGCVFGSRTNKDVDEIHLTTFTSSNYTNGNFKYGTGRYSAHIKTQEIVNVKLEKQIYYVDNKEKMNLTNTNFSNNDSIYIFAINNWGTSSEYGKVKLYYFRLYNSEYLIKCFIPCKRKLDNKPGLYDTVEGKFYTNQNTNGDDFIVGPNV